MNLHDMLANLSERGDDAGSDLHDGLEGWFGWTVRGDLLTVTWKPAGEGCAGGDAATASWRLVPVAEQ